MCLLDQLLVLKSKTIFWPNKICTSRRKITFLLIQKDLRLFFLFFFYQLIHHHFHKFTFITSCPSLAFFWFFVSTVSLITYVERDHRALHFKYADHFVVGLCDLFSSERQKVQQQRLKVAKTIGKIILATMSILFDLKRD